MNDHNQHAQNVGRHAMGQALNNSQQNVMAGTPTLLYHIDFPDVEHYGHDHAQQTSDCAMRIFASLPLFSEGPTWQQKLRLETVRLTGLLHDIGRLAPWTESDPGHGQRSAAMAEKLIRDDPKFVPDPDLRDKLMHDVPRIISKHDLKGAHPTNPCAQALWDADSYEILRFEVGQLAHLRGPVKKRMSRLITPWACEIENQRRWRVYRGWA